MKYPFELQALNYDYAALEPFIDAATMELHHSKHLQTYITNLNNALQDYPEFQHFTIKELLNNLAELPEQIRMTVRNNGGGVYNHNLFFDILAKNEPIPTSGPLYDGITKDFESFDNLKAQLKAAGLSIFGSGWAWLVLNHLGKLSIIKTPNQDVPDLNLYQPILNLDVWEHAYYLKNQNRRAEYIDNFFNVINWQTVAANYEG